MRDDFYWFRVHDHIDEHPKIEPLSDGAFRLLLETWAYCRRNANDGQIADAVWKKRGKPRTRKELLDARLAEQHDGYVQVHDYLDWQQSAAEIDEARAKKSKAGALGNHKKWHTGRGRFDPSCEFCTPPPDDPDRSHARSQMRSQERSQNGHVTDEPGTAKSQDLFDGQALDYRADDGSSEPPHDSSLAERDRSRHGRADETASQMRSHLPRKRIAEVEGERELLGYVEGGSHVPNASDTPPPFPDHCPEHAHDPMPPPCGRCADARKAWAARPPLALVTPDTRRCIVHDETYTTVCRGCRADEIARPDTAPEAS